jgi:hypothetical protein
MHPSIKFSQLIKNSIFETSDHEKSPFVFTVIRFASPLLQQKHGNNHQGGKTHLPS